MSIHGMELIVVCITLPLIFLNIRVCVLDVHVLHGVIDDCGLNQLIVPSIHRMRVLK